MTCVNNQDEITELHKFRISARNTEPSCPMEAIRCNPDQDACVKVVMHMGNGYFWIGSGCDYQKNFHHIACKTEPVYTRSIQNGQIYERRTPQRTCVCTFDLCNVSTKLRSKTIYIHLCLVLLHLLQFYDFR
ncbi:unnamed protein product [Enterobius vermicularis]|uniref:Activin_recp domain-containing protein n=1 Tax=Enterobius vermicularis TaxID=51028 RepID=A0A0N4V825_ENTVE|nr:unnamed protein product [Enterobius vermicularis]